MRAGLLLAILAAMPLPAMAATNPVGLPAITFHLDHAAYVTLVIEDAAGKRVRNLIAETRFPAGDNVVTWDGYDEGERQANGDVIRRRVAPGQYHARGLVHDGLSLTYEFSVYSPGDPAWHTDDGHGAWLADHTPPADVLWLAADSGAAYAQAKPVLLAVSNAPETGHGMVWLDEDGHKLFGFHGGAARGKALAHDAGAKAIAGDYAYVLLVDQGANGAFELTALGSQSPTKPQPIIKLPIRAVVMPDGDFGYAALAVRDGVAVITNAYDDEVIIVDIRQKKQLGTVPMPRPRGVAFDAAGALLMVTDGQIKRFALRADGSGLDLQDVVVGAGLEDPQRLVLGANGEMYVGDWGASHQVKIFSGDAKPAKTIGKPGGQMLGVYDEGRMQRPLGMTLDGRGRLWVCEDDFLPKRISVWNIADGSLAHAYYGGPKYGGGGSIDPTDKTRFYYASAMNWGSLGAMEFKLDWEHGTSKLAYIITRGPVPDDKQMRFWSQMFGEDPIWHDWSAYQRFLPGDTARGTPPQWPIYVNGRQYMVNTFYGNGGPSGTGSVWVLNEQHIARPVSMFGGLLDWNNHYQPFSAHIKARDAVMALWQGQSFEYQRDRAWIWSDLNGDGSVQLEEVQNRKGDLLDARRRRFGDYSCPHAYVMNDLSLVLPFGTHVPVKGYAPGGAPQYDLAAAEQIEPVKENGFPILTDAGWYVNVGNTIRGFHAGAEWWHMNTSYGNDVPIPQGGGQLIQVQDPLGPPVRLPNNGGEFIALGANKGNIFLMTSDGLYLQTLGADMRVAPLWRMPQAQRGMLIDSPEHHITFEDEHYNPSMTQFPDGQVYVVAGKEHSSILHLEGLASVHRTDFGDLTIGADTLTSMPESITQRVRKTERQQASIAVLSAPLPTDATGAHVDSEQLPDALWKPIDARASALLAAYGGKLYVAYRTGDEHLLENGGGGGDEKLLFKTGGALDLMLGVDPQADPRRRTPVAGDERLLVSRVAGKLAALLYRAVVPGAPAEARAKFSSPLGDVYFDRVDDVSSQIILAQSGGDYVLTVPMDVLGLPDKLPARQAILADVGMLRGDGHQTAQRVYWNNLDTAIVSDVPSEVRLMPGNWGRWDFKLFHSAGAQLPAVVLPAGSKPLAGLNYSYYEFLGSWGRLPDFTTAKLTPTKTGTTPAIAPGPAGRGIHYGLVFDGLLTIPQDGIYTFILASSAGAKLWIDDNLIVDNDGLHKLIENVGCACLQSGRHRIRVAYFQDIGDAMLQLSMQTAGNKAMPVAAETLSHLP